MDESNAVSVRYMFVTKVDFIRVVNILFSMESYVFADNHWKVILIIVLKD